MHSTLRSIPRTLTLLTAITLAACASPSPTVPSPVIPPPATVTALTIGGLPAYSSLGQSIQLTANVTLNNGTQKQTLDATWQSSDTAVATVSTGGLMTVTGVGEADITATLQNVHATAHTTVPIQPAPVARLDVTIDSHGSSRAIFNASDITFDMSGSTGFGLRYDVAFGDGSSSSDAPTAKHIYVMTPDSPHFVNYLVRATVTDGLGRTDTVTQTVSVISLAFGWSGTWYNPPGRCGLGHPGVRLFIMIGAQDGRNVRGDFHYADDLAKISTVTTLTGTLGIGGDIHLVLDDGSIAFDGPVIMKDFSYLSAHMLLKIRGGPEDGRTLDFELCQY
jgi:Big-like domain-containing protein